jgi:hypothetical protein
MCATSGEANTRAWYRLHTSTIVVMLAAFVLLAVWSASAFYYMGSYPIDELWLHGWPATFLVRKLDDSFANDYWGFTRGVLEFSPWTLALDFFAIVLATVGFGIVTEWRRRRRPTLMSVSLKEFFLLWTAIALLFGYWYREHSIKVAWLRSVEKLGGAESFFAADHSVPKWLWNLLPGDKLKIGDTPVGMSLRNANSPVIDIRELRKFTKLRWLLAEHYPQVKIDAHAVVFRNMRDLRVLILTDSDLSDEGAVHLSNLTQLEFLRLTNRITDAGVQHLRNLKHLKSISLHGARITDKSLEVFAGLPHLEELSVRSTEISDAGAEELQKLRPALTIYR